jgi:hypothetical protein
MEEDARRMDTLQARLAQLQARYNQVQHMLSVPPVSGAKAEKAAKAAKTESLGSTKPD